MIHLRDAFYMTVLSNILLICAAGCSALAYDSWRPMQVALTITSMTFLTGALAVLPLVWINIRTAFGKSE